VDLPVVYIEKEPFLNMLLSAAETHKRECFGYIFGHKPTKENNCFVVTNAAAVQLARKRKNKEIEQSRASRARMREYFSRYSTLYPMLGDFHSHPEWGDYVREMTLSDGDLEDMIKDNFLIGVVIKVVSVNKDRLLWQRATHGGLKGSLGKFKFYVTVGRAIKGRGGKLHNECLTIHAPAAIKALNRALGYGS